MKSNYRVSLALIALTAMSAIPVIAGAMWSASGDSDRSARATAAGGELRTPEAFATISDPAERSAAIFVEAAQVLTHPRCVNCHADGDRPLQGEEGHPHQPWVRRGTDGFGVPGLRCATCHTDENYDPAGVPGAPSWHLAPREMAWQGKSLPEICEQLKDPERNGNRSLHDLIEHAGTDPLVGWGWFPGADREPAPGTQAAFRDLIAAWVADGAACPM